MAAALAGLVAESPRQVFISFGHGGYAQIGRMLAFHLQARGHDVWFDELKLEGGAKWADEMEKGLRDASGDKPKVVVFLMDYYGLRLGEPDFFPNAWGKGFCHNEMSVTMDEGLDLIVVGLADAVPPKRLADPDAGRVAFDVRGLMGDRLLGLGDQVEEHAFKALQAAQRAGKAPFNALPMSKLSKLDKISETKQGMSVFFSHRWGACKAVQSIVELVEGGDYSADAIRAKAAEVPGAAATPICEFTHFGRSWKDLARGSLPPPKGVEAARARAAATSEADQGGPQRVFLAGERSMHGMMAAIAERLRDQGHSVEYEPERLFAEPAVSQGYAQAAIEWACSSEVPKPTAVDVELASSARGSFVLVMTDGSVGLSPEGMCKPFITYAGYNALPIIPIRASYVKAPLQICTLQYIDAARTGFVAGADAPPASSAFDDAMDQLSGALVTGLDSLGSANADRVQLENSLQPFEMSAEMGNHKLRLSGRGWLCREIHAWLDDDAAPTVRVYESAPGTGKTALAAFLTRQAKSVAAQHLATDDDEASCDLRRVITSLAFQICTRTMRGQAALLGEGGAARTRVFNAAEPESEHNPALLGKLCQIGSPFVLGRELLVNTLLPLLKPTDGDAEGAGRGSPEPAAAAASASAASPSSAAARGGPASTPDYLPSFTPDAQGSAASGGMPDDALRSSKGRVMVIIDGLERIRIDGKRDPALVLGVLSRLGALMRERTPWVRLLVLDGTDSRSARAVAAAGAAPTGPVLLEGAEPRPLARAVEVVDMVGRPGSPRHEASREDLRAFARSLLAEGGAPDEAKARLVADKAEGNFMFASSAVALVRETDVSADDLGSFLASQDSIFGRQWAAQQAKIEALGSPRLRELCYDLIGVVAASKEPLPSTVILSGILHVGLAHERKAVLEAASPCFVTRGQSMAVQPMHSALPGWLVKSGKVDRMAGHRLIALWGVGVARQAEHVCDSGEPGQGREAAFDWIRKQSGGQYVLRNLLGHVKEARGTAGASGEVLDACKWLLDRCEPTDPAEPGRKRLVDFALKVAALRRVGIERLSHGDIDRKAVVEPMLAAASATMRKPFLIRLSARAGPGTMVVSYTHDGVPPVHAKIHSYEGDKFSLVEPGKPGFNPEDCYRDLAAVVAHQQVIGVLGEPVLSSAPRE